MKVIQSMVGRQPITLPRLYAIADASFFSATEDLLCFARELAAGGVTLLQYRNKTGSARQILDHALVLKQSLPASVQLIMNDRADLCLAAKFDGVHLGQDDLSAESARRLLGDKRWLGVSTHNPEQVAAADATPADYVAVGPVFATNSKERPDPVIGLEGVRRARALTRKPLVAIGGIARENCRSVVDAGADSVAVISDLIRSPRTAAQDFLRLFAAS
jgi:thiamine-phosphate pyrophosphorylase